MHCGILNSTISIIYLHLFSLPILQFFVLLLHQEEAVMWARRLKIAYFFIFWLNRAKFDRACECPANGSAWSSMVPHVQHAGALPRCPAVSRKFPQVSSMVQQWSSKFPQSTATSHMLDVRDHAGPCWTICGTLTRAIELRTIQPKKKKSRRF